MGHRQVNPQELCTWRQMTDEIGAMLEEEPVVVPARAKGERLKELKGLGYRDGSVNKSSAV